MAWFLSAQNISEIMSEALDFVYTDAAFSYEGHDGSVSMINHLRCTWIYLGYMSSLGSFHLSVFAECHFELRSLIDKILVFWEISLDSADTTSWCIVHRQPDSWWGDYIRFISTAFSWVRPRRNTPARTWPITKNWINPELNNWMQRKCVA